MSGQDFTNCPSCQSDRYGRPFPSDDELPFLFCEACGLIANEFVEPDLELADFRRALDVVAGGGEGAYFDLPNVLPALHEGTFWDLRAGSATHFTPGSFARFVRSCGFDVTELRLVGLDDRRFHLKAMRAAGPTRPRFQREDDLVAIAEAVVAVPAAAERQIVKWRRVLGEFLDEGKWVTVYGPPLSVDAFLRAAAPNDARRVSRVIEPDMPPDVVIALNAAYQMEADQLLPSFGRRTLVLTP
jgi:hypothetical protein